MPKSGSRPEVAIIAPSVFPAKRAGDHYGFENVLPALADGLNMYMPTTLIAPKGSDANHAKVRTTIDPPSQWGEEEQQAYEVYGPWLKDYDVVIDWSHKKLAYEQGALVLLGPLPGVQVQIPHGRNSPCLISLSEWHRRDTMARFGHDSRVIHLCPDPDDYPLIEKKDGFVLAFGAMLPHKGVLDLVKTWPKKSKHPLIVAGGEFGAPKEYVDAVRAACEENDMEYRGPIGWQEKLDLLGSARAVVTAFTRREAWSMLSVEAQLMGTHVFTLDHKDGVPATGKFRNVGDMICEVTSKTFKQDPAGIRKAVLENFGYDKMVAMYRDAISAVLEGRYW